MTKKPTSMAQLDEYQLAALRDLETQLGVSLVMFPLPVSQMAHLSEEQLELVRAKERELGVVLVALEPSG